MSGRVEDMARIVVNNPELLVKLAATSMGLSVAIAKLYSYKASTLTEIKKDYDFYEEMMQAYMDSADFDDNFAEKLSGVSAEVDKLMLELDKDNDTR